MDKNRFKELVASLREAKEIVRGEIKPARRRKLKPESPQFVRVRLGLTQSEFARLFGVPRQTVIEWERGKARPTGPARLLMRIAARDPALVLACRRSGKGTE